MARLEAAGREQVLLGGGGTLNSSFVQAGRLDEIVIFMESVVVGRGVPAFSPAFDDLHLDLVEFSGVDKALVSLRYAERRAP